MQIIKCWQIFAGWSRSVPHCELVNGILLFLIVVDSIIYELKHDDVKWTENKSHYINAFEYFMMMFYRHFCSLSASHHLNLFAPPIKGISIKFIICPLLLGLLRNFNATIKSTQLLTSSSMFCVPCSIKTAIRRWGK